MGKKGGGGGGGGTPQINVPAGLYQGAQATTGLGQYATSLFNPLAGMTNWAAGIASNQTAGQIPQFQNVATQAGPQVYFGDPSSGAGGNNLWNTSYDPQTGLITYTNARDPAQTFTGTPTGETGSLDPATKQRWSDIYAQNQWAAAGGTGAPGVGAPVNNPGPVTIPGYGTLTADQVGQYLSATPDERQQVASALGLSAQQINQAISSAQQTMALGPFLGQSWADIQQEQAATGQIAGIQGETASLAQSLAQQGTQLAATGQTELTEATTGTGLFPSQQAYVTQATQAGEADIASKLGAMGLSQSTMAASLKNQVEQAGAATAGQLVQGNISAAQQTISLGNAVNQLALGAQTLQLGEQSALVTELATISQQSAQFQAQMWTEALQGYGMLGNLISVAGQQYGYSIGAYESVLQANVQQANLQAQQEEAAASADAQSSSGLFGALGKALGGLGGALGGGGAAAGGAAAGGAAAAGGGGSMIGSIVSVVGGILAAL